MANQISLNPSVPSQVVQEVKFPKFVNNLGIIPTSYKDSMSYYECLAWLCKYLEETVIPTVNQNGEAVEELQGLYVEFTENIVDLYNELKNYVDNYLTDETIQPLINNKLDEMVEDGTLNEIISGYINNTMLQVFNTVSDLKNAQLNAGQKVKTLGYYNINDGGQAFYYIQSETPSGYYETLNNGKYAKLITQNSYNLKQVGCYGDGTHDDATKINSIITLMKSKFNSNNYDINTLIFPEGNYRIESQITIPNFINLKAIGTVTISSYVSSISLLFDNSSVTASGYYHMTGEKVEGNFILINKDETNLETIAIQFQTNSSPSGSENFNAWNVFKNFTIRYFNTGIKLIMKNLFLKTFRNILIENCNQAILFDTMVSNSGERITFENCTIGDCTNGILINTSSLELCLSNCSIDFTDKMIKLTQSGIIVKLNNCHFEGCGFANSGEMTQEANPYILYNDRSYFGSNMIFINNCDIMTIRSIPFQASTKNGVNLFITGLTTKGNANWKKSYILCDDNCNIVSSDFYPSLYDMMILQNKINEKVESNLANIENQNISNNAVIDGYTFSVGVSGQTSITDERYHNSGKSIKFVVPTGGAYFTITSEEFDVIPNKILTNSFLFYYLSGETSKTFRVAIKTTFYDKDGNALTYPTSEVDASINYNETGANNWERMYQFENIVIPPFAKTAKTVYIINPVKDGTLYLTDFYRSQY